MEAQPSNACQSHLTEILDPVGTERETAGHLAHRLIDEFGTLGAVLAAPVERIRHLLLGAPAAAAKIERFREAMLHGLRTDLSGNEAIENVPALLRLVNARIGNAPNEQMLILFFDAQHRLIRDEITAQGSVSSVGLEPRFILRRALELSATSVILAHNHPSGDARLSAADRTYTSRLAYACRSVGIALLDHIVVASGGHTSFREQGLI